MVGQVRLEVGVGPVELGGPGAEGLQHRRRQLGADLFELRTVRRVGLDDLRHPGQVLSRQQILSAIWDYAFDPGSNVVDVYVRYLRSKIDRAGEPSLITTVRGSGYRFDPGPE